MKTFNPENLHNKPVTKYPVKTDINGNFNSANPELAFNLPALTSPGWIDSATCTGLDYLNTNPDYSKLTFNECLMKYNESYNIPENAFSSLIKNLNYTFDSLPEDKKKYYLSIN